MNTAAKILEFPTATKKRSSRTTGTKSAYSGLTDPIKSVEDIERAKAYFLSQPQTYRSKNIRNYLMFVMGINIARRIGDMLQFKIGDVVYKNGTVRDYMIIREQKTGKKAKFGLNNSVKEAIKMYLDSLGNSYNMDDYLFKSHKGNNQPIDRRSAWRILKQMAAAIGLKENIGTHSMRKTKAYHTIKSSNKDPYVIMKVQKMLNHSKSATTLRYCGIDDEEMMKLYDFEL